MKYIIAFILLVFFALVLYIKYYNKESFANNEDDYIIDIATGANHSVFLNKYGKSFICGKNVNGRLGTGNNVSIILPISIQNITKIQKIYAGNVNTFFITKEGAVYASGENSQGQLGIGNLDNQFVPIPIPFFKDIPISKVAAGWYHTLFLTTSGDVYVCGDNKYGQLANGTNVSIYSPIKLDLKCSDIAAGQGHSVFLTTDEKVYTAGWNWYGQLGNNITRNSNIPVLFDTTDKITKVYAGMSHTLLLNDTGKVYVCGDNTKGQIALSHTITNQRAFTLLKNLPPDDKIVDVSAGQTHTLFLTNKGHVYSVGLNELGQQFVAKNKKDQQVLVNKIKTDLDKIKKDHQELVAKIKKEKQNLAKIKKGKPALIAKIKKYEQNLAKIKKDQQYLVAKIKKEQDVLSFNNQVQPDVSFNNPQKISLNNKEISKIATGSNHSLFLTKNGLVYASGDNTMGGQLGVKNISYANKPVLCDIEIQKIKDDRTYQIDVAGPSNN